jgi:hypothetical protein
MSANASAGFQDSGTTESTTEEDCDACATLADGHPCAKCFISGRKDFEGGDD